MSTSSQPSSSSSIPSTSQLSRGKVQKEKMKVIFQVDGSVVGEYAKVWNTRTRDLVESHIPIHCPDWRIVPDNFKDDVWTALMSEFELNVPPKVARPLAEKTWSQKFRTYKSTLRVITKNNDRMSLEPKGVDPHIWRNFVKNESDPKKQLQNAKNSENRKMLKIPHCLGRRTYAQKQYMMEQENPGKKIRRVDKWYVAHERPGGTVLQSARSKYDEVKAAESRRKGTGMKGDGFSDDFEDIDNDELTEVFGKDKKGGVRAVGSNISKKQLLHVGVAMTEIEQDKKIIKEAASLKDQIISHVDSRLDNFERVMQAMFLKLSSDKENVPPVVNNTPLNEFSSNSTHHPLS